MRKLKFVGLFIAAGLLMQSAYANCTGPVMQTGGQACIAMGSSYPYVYTCQSNGTWVKTGGYCYCSNTAILNENSGHQYCQGAYTTSQASANMTYASNGFSKSAQ